MSPYRILFSMLVIMLLLISGIASATLISEHRHCSTMDWSQEFTVAANATEGSPTTVQSNDQSLLPIPRAKPFEGSRECKYELSDITSIRVNLELGIVGADDPPFIRHTGFSINSLTTQPFGVGVNFNTDRIAGPETVLEISLTPHLDFTFSDLVQTNLIDFILMVQSCTQDACFGDGSSVISGPPLKFKSIAGPRVLSVQLSGHHYYLSEPSSVLLFSVAIFLIGYMGPLRAQSK